MLFVLCLPSTEKQSCSYQGPSQLKSNHWCWQTQAPMSLYVRFVVETLLQLFNNFQCHTQIDLRYRKGRQCLTSWNIEKIKSRTPDLSTSTESTSTVAFGKLFQILTLPLVKKTFSKIIMAFIGLLIIFIVHFLIVIVIARLVFPMKCCVSRAT